MISVKQSTIFSIVFFSKIGQEIVLSYGVERKEGFEHDKNVNFLKSKKWVNPWFRSKNPQFFLVCFQQNRPKNNVKLRSRKERSF